GAGHRLDDDRCAAPDLYAPDADAVRAMQADGGHDGHPGSAYAGRGAGAASPSASAWTSARSTSRSSAPTPSSASAVTYRTCGSRPATPAVRLWTTRPVSVSGARPAATSVTSPEESGRRGGSASMSR